MSLLHLCDGRRGRTSPESGSLGAGRSKPPCLGPVTDDIQAPSPPLVQLLQDMRVEDLVERAKSLTECAVITDSTLVSSYNWISSVGRYKNLPSQCPVHVFVIWFYAMRRSSSVIADFGDLNPGRPPGWTPMSIRLRDDNSNLGGGRLNGIREECRDQNAAQFSKHPMEPAIVATF